MRYFPRIIFCLCFSAFAVFGIAADTSQTAGGENKTPAASPGDKPAKKKPKKYHGYVHDPSSIVKCGDEYWFFSTGGGIASHHSKDMIHWQAGPVVFRRSPAWVARTIPGNRGDFWAPDVIYHNKQYYLYYSASHFGKNQSAIGLAVNQTLDPNDPNYKWIDQGVVIQSQESDDFNAIDPAVTLDAKGNLWLAFGSFWDGIKLIQLDPATGKGLSSGSPIHSLARKEQIEAASIHYHDGYYYLFVNWGWCCQGEYSTYNIRVGRSREITGPYLDKDGNDLAKGGGSLFLESANEEIGPGHPGIITVNGTDWMSFHYYDGNWYGVGTLAVRRLNWNADGWPMIDKSADGNL